MKSNVLYTIYILWLRQIKRYMRSKSRMIGSLGQPVLFLVALGFGFGPTFAKAGGGDYMQFLAPGIIAMSILFTSVFSGIEIIWDRQFGFLKETLVAPVSRLSIMIGRTLGGATTAFVQGIIVLLITLVVGFRPEFIIGHIILAFLFMFGISVVFTACGTAMASVMEDIQGFGLIVNLVIMPTFFLSGALFPLDGSPAIIRFITSINPLTYGVDGVRTMLSGITHFGAALDGGILVIVAVIITTIGAYLFSKIKI